MDEIAEAIKQLTKAQLNAFERIAIGLDFGVHPKTVGVLLRLGLVEAEAETRPSWPTPVTITRYYVPLPVHIEWCSLCSDRVDKREAKRRKRVDA